MKKIGAKPSGAAYISNDMDEVAFMARVMLEEKDSFVSELFVVVVPPPTFPLPLNIKANQWSSTPVAPLIVNVPSCVIVRLSPFASELVFPKAIDPPGLRDILRRR